jgi:hypothetical protein
MINEANGYIELGLPALQVFRMHHGFHKMYTTKTQKAPSPQIVGHGTTVITCNDATTRTDGHGDAKDGEEESRNDCGLLMV